MFCIKHNKKLIVINKYTLNKKEIDKYHFKAFHHTQKVYISTKFRTKEEAENIVSELVCYNNKVYDKLKEWVDILNANGFNCFNNKTYDEYNSLGYDAKTKLQVILPGNNFYYVRDIYNIYEQYSYFSILKCQDTSAFTIVEVKNNFIEVFDRKKIKIRLKKNDSFQDKCSKFSYMACTRCGAVLMDVNYVYISNRQNEVALCPMCIKALSENIDNEINNIQPEILNEYYAKVLCSAL